MRIGYGFDSHEFRPGIPLKIGGITLSHDQGLGGHSDGDVLLHAITDALLGAIAAPDIGALFPPSDPKWKGAASLIFLEYTRKLLDERHLRITHLDAIVVLERPKLGPHFPAMREAVAKSLGIRTDQINLKAKTNESVDAVGRGEAIACHTIATLEG